MSAPIPERDEHIVDALQAIPWVRDVQQSKAPHGEYVLLTDCSILDTDDEHTIENCGVVRRATSGVGDYQGLKVYVDMQ